jgi:hypothetical protein
VAVRSQGIRHQWPTVGEPNSRTQPERCSRCRLLRRTVAGKPYQYGPTHYYWRYGEGAVEALARTPGECPGETQAEVAHAA